MAASLSTARAQLGAYLRLARLDRPVGIWLLLWPTLWGLWVAADGLPDLQVLAVFVLGTVLMRSAGCAINDYADRGFDPHVARTRGRPLATGELSPDQALRLFVVLSLIAFGLVSSLRNTVLLIACLPAVALAALYPFTKRFLQAPQVVLGIAFSCGIPMAWIALGQPLEAVAIGLLMGANLAWVVAYDTWYAMVDRDDDRRIGVRSTALLFGAHDRLAIGLLQLLALLLLAVLGLRQGYGAVYFAGLVLAGLLAARDHHRAASRDPAACFQAFLASHRFGAVILLGLVVDRLG
ncbi:MAG TPA: 4-hydroxybenzoate octaprenyltransferase [Nevskiaceae bacterium]|nr:4-hydroxybenzoate octaprenyltransferase [Nevskiaceae bacterium]